MISSVFVDPHPGAGSSDFTARASFWILTVALLILGVASYLTIHLDHPFLIATNSRALYVDEGFYAEAAQNLVKFGRWQFPYDFPQWAGAPFLTLLQSLVFPVFGADLETARMLSTFMSLVTGLAFYAIARMSMPPIAALLLTLAGLTTINFVAHARSALVDPTALCLALLALLTYVRIQRRSAAIPLSIALAFAASLTKMYFVFTLVAVLGLWVLELILAPAVARRAIHKKQLVILAASLATAGIVFAFYLYLFWERVSDYYAINSGKIPWLNIDYLVNSLVGALKLLPYNTKTQVFLSVILAAPMFILAMLLWPRTRAGIVTRFRQLGRAELAIGLWLISGLAVIGVLSIPKPHYHFFAILPLCFVGAVGLKLVFPVSLHTLVIGAAAAAHFVFQLPLYLEWSQRDQKTAIVDSSREVVRIIEQSTDEDMIPVIGEYSAELGLFSDRIFPLDVKWSPSYHYCRRIQVWKPRFHVNIVWPGSLSRREPEDVEKCPFVADTRVIGRWTLFEPRRDELVLSRIHYK